MSNKIRIKKSSVAAKVPLVADLDYGELAINYADGLLYYKKSDATIQSISSGGIETLATVTGRGATTTVAISTGAITSSGNILVGATSVFNFNGNAWGVDKIIFRTDVLQKILTDGSGNFDWLTAGKNWTLSDVGNVGIGTSSPSFKLQVAGTDNNNAIQSYNTATGNAGLRIQANAAGLYLQGSGTVDPLYISNTSATGYIAFRPSADTERMRIDPTGNVGIGITAPGARLEVYDSNGNTNVTAGIKVTNGSGTANSASGIVFQNYDNYGAWIRSVRSGGTAGILTFGTNNGVGIAESNINERMRIDSGGNVGVGTTTMVGKFNVYATSENVALFQTTVTQAIVRFRDSTTTYDPYIASYGNAMAFGRYGAGESMRIDASGNLGIGTTAPTSGFILDANGSILARTDLRVGGTSGSLLWANTSGGYLAVSSIMSRENASTLSLSGRQSASSGQPGVLISTAGGLVATDIAVQMGASGGGQVYLLQSGNVGVGNASPTYKLDVLQTDTGLGAALLKHSNGNAIIVNPSYNYYDAYNHIFRGLLGTTTHMTLDVNGNLGIGVTAPASSLHIIGTAAGQTTGAITDAGSMSGIITVADSNNQLAGGGGGIVFGSGATRFAAIKGYTTGGAGSTIGDLIFSTRNATADTALSERMRILVNGNVGIGTTSPAAKLDLGGSTASSVQQIFGRGVTDTDFTVRYTNGVAGDSAFIGTLGLDYANGVWADMAAIKFFRRSTAGELAFFASAATAAGTEQMRITSTGVGIGATNPSRKLHVNGPGVQFSNTGGEHSLLIGDQNYAYWNLYTPASPTYLSFQWNSAEKMRIDNAGGLTTAGSLNVNGGVSLKDANNIASITQTAITLTGGTAGTPFVHGQSVNIITTTTAVGFLIVASSQGVAGTFYINAGLATNLISQSTIDTRFSATADSANTANVFRSGNNIVLQNSIQATRDFYVTFIGKL